MSGPLDPDDAFWNELKKNPAYDRAWNAALWEAFKLIGEWPPIDRDLILAELRGLVRR